MSLANDVSAAAPTDAELIARCAAVIDVPKEAPPDSFVLHAPLELLARALLLERVPSDARPRARQRLEWLADTYAAAGPSATSTPPADDRAIDDVLLSLAAAGHAPILLSLRARVDVVPATFGSRLVAGEMARYPDWSLSWPRVRNATGVSRGDLAEQLAAPRSPGDPGSDFIYPTMHLVDESGLAAEVLDGPLRSMRVDDARRTLLRVAAQSMLQDNPDAAPYGWTHCLTMPQAVLATAGQATDPDLAVAVAATYVLGFRATQGRVRLDPAWTPAPDSAAERVWRASDDDLVPLVDEIVTYGAIHRDAHVAKYTLACLDATADDPDAGRLFLAAAANLHEWWKAVE
ncbi:MAG TPA: hypothetical protein VFB78_04920 [Acidimicrobiales bacterium]|nr:hypothetical protein [Acidimicrobiales bacterium]